MVDSAIDDRWVDVDFTKDPRYVFGDLGARMFGSPNYEQSFGVMDDADIRAAIEAADAQEAWLDKLVKRILNQKQEGSCVGNATAQAYMVAQAKIVGIENIVEISAMSIYKQIGTSAQSGAVVSDAWDAIRDVGCLPLDTPENREKFGNHVMPATGFSTPWPSDWKQTAARFQGKEAWQINTLPGLLTALVCGHPVVVGREGHSIVYLRPAWRNGQYMVRYANSWNDDWGEQGFGWDTLRQIQQSARYAFAVRDVEIAA